MCSGSSAPCTLQFTGGSRRSTGTWSTMGFGFYRAAAVSGRVSGAVVCTRLHHLEISSLAPLVALPHCLTLGHCVLRESYSFWRAHLLSANPWRDTTNI